MFRKTDPLRLKILRGVILNLLYMAAQGEALNPDDPMSMSRDVLTLTMEQLKSLPSSEDLHSSLRYLDAKRYVEVDWSHDGSGRFNTVRLLPTGMDLVERSVSDPGVVFQQRRV